jgi:hypothetical protein
MQGLSQAATRHRPRLLEFCVRWLLGVLNFVLLAATIHTVTVQAFLSVALQAHTNGLPQNRLIRSTSSVGMSSTSSWSAAWKDILNGGSKRWKIEDLHVKQQALHYLVKEAHRHRYNNDSKVLQVTASDGTANANTNANIDPTILNILCPLAGDDPFVYYAWSQGHFVTTMDIVPEAVQAMRRQFANSGSMEKDNEDDDADWTCEILHEQQQSQNDNENSPTTTTTTKIWNHVSGRATLYEGDMLQPARSELVGRFSAIYDKDSFGALDTSMRVNYCQRLADYTQDYAPAYVEVKWKQAVAERHAANTGPPFHVDRNDLIEPTNFGTFFEHISSLGQVADLAHMSGMSQTAHLLRRLPRMR